VTDTLAGTISTVRGYDLPIGRDEVWEQISAVDNYRSWWPWLRRFEADGLIAGSEWRCEVQPPLPYIVRFGVAIEKVEAPTLVHARVLGDVVGDATLELEETDDGCRAVLRSALAPGNAALRLVSRFTAPLARFGHDWVLDSGARQFIARVAPPRPVD
jgi:uncharacterized protein YndB with AHSA1/START domain